MVIRISTLIALLTLTLAGTISAADPTMDTATAIFNDSFRTLQTKVNGNDQLPPVIMMGSDDRLTVSFDELASERRYMRYELIHCNAAWHADALLPAEYVDGFNEATVDLYSYSQATLVQYVHYEIVIPDPDLDIKLSGNYLLRIYDESDPATTLLQTRFSVVESAMTARAEVTSRTDIDYNDSHQQLTVAVDTKGIDVSNMINDIIIEVTQNGRTDNAVRINRPTRIAGTTAIWEHSPQLIFPAGNEYRRMEIVSTTYPGMHVADIVYADPIYHFRLAADRTRATMPYSFDSTQKGRFRIREFNSDDSDIEADYAMTHFTLDIPEMHGADIFLDGDFTQRRFGPESLMVYNRVSGLYEASVLLKQGAYNYQYLTVPHGSSTGFTAEIEGDFYPTANEYIVKVFYREPGSRYDRLVAVTSATAGT